MKAISIRDNLACGRVLTLTLLPWSKLFIWFKIWTSWLVPACVSIFFCCDSANFIDKDGSGSFCMKNTSFTMCSPSLGQFSTNSDLTLNLTMWMNEAVVYSTYSGGTRELHKSVESLTNDSIL